MPPLVELLIGGFPLVVDSLPFVPVDPSVVLLSPPVVVLRLLVVVGAVGVWVLFDVEGGLVVVFGGGSSWLDVKVEPFVVVGGGGGSLVVVGWFWDVWVVVQVLCVVVVGSLSSVLITVLLVLVGGGLSSVGVPVGVDVVSLVLVGICDVDSLVGVEVELASSEALELVCLGR